MKIYLPSDSRQTLGGGFTFRRNLSKGLTGLGHQIVDNISEAQIAVVSGATMVTRDTIRAVKESGAKLVVRIDNVPRNSRNRNTGTSRLKDFTRQADEVVWQCNWARDYLIDFVQRKGVVIYNGVDTDIFHETRKENDYYLFDGRGRENYYLYSRFNRDETKNWEVAWYKYQLIQKENKEAKLIIVGKFSPEQLEYNFDFFRGENFEYLGVISNPQEMAKIYRSCGHLMATYYNDCYSNTYLEALASGMKLYKPNMTGGTPELIKNGVSTIQEMTKNYEKLFESLLKGGE